MTTTVDTTGQPLEAAHPSSEEMSGLVERYTENLMRGALSMGFSLSEAEELVQDTFYAYLTGGARFKKRSQLLTYLFGILYNKVRETRRYHGRHDSIDAAVDDRFKDQFGPLGDSWEPDGHWNMKNIGYFTEVEKQVASSNLGELLAACLEGLTTDMRMAFTMKEVEGCEPDQICDALSVSRTNLGVLLFRARNKLRDCLIGKGAVIV